MKVKQQGFTLIELVVVIVVLGILGVVAAPRFINFQDDARIAALSGLGGALQSANSLVHSKAAIEGEEDLAFNATNAPAIDVGTGTNAVPNFGSIQSTAAELSNAMNLNISSDESVNADWYIAEGANGAAAAVLYQAGSARFGNTDASTNRCFLTYTPAASATTDPTYVVTNDDC